MKVESPEVLKQERPLTIEEKAKLFPLSYWMRLGAKMRPQCFGKRTDGVGTCALGAAMDAVGALDIAAELRVNRHRDVHGFFGIFFGPSTKPISEIFPQFEGIIKGTKLEIAICIRNNWGMTREEIADWLESQGY